MRRNYILLALVLFAILSIWQLKKVVELRYRSTDAALPIVEITARTVSGSYVDATQYIKDGITQLTAAGGGVLFFGPGKYLVQETIVIPSNVIIQGVGAGEVGPTMIVLGNNGDMNANGMALFSIAPGAENVVIKDIELRSMTPGPDVYPRYDLDRIRDEGTVGLKISGGGSATRNIRLENVRTINFTYGVDAGSSDGSNPIIDNVKIKNLVSSVNHLGMRVRSLNARNWDVQNYNLVEISNQQDGVLLERVGKISFLQLSCASTLWDGDLCLDVRERAGALHLAQMHVEGPAEGVRVRASSSHPIYFENSAMGSVVIEEQNVIYSYANRMSLDDASGRISFINNGTQSTLYKCADVFTNGYPNPNENYPADPYPGLSSVPVGCNFDVESIPNPFSTDILGFEPFEWVTSDSSPSAPVLNVKNFNAAGDGVTDDTAAFRAAMRDGATTWASTIIVPAGTYKISDTLVLEDGLTILGDGNATILFTATDRPLFQVRAMQSDLIIDRGVGVKNLSLTHSTPNSPGTASAIELSGNRGAAGDFIFSDLNVTGFARGMHIRNDSGLFDTDQPQFDTIAVRNLTFSNNGIAIDMRDQNASNWNIVNTTIQGMKAGQKGIKIDGGGAWIQNLTCVGESSQNPASSCVELGRIGGFRMENMTATNTTHAVYVEWSMGWTPFPVMIKNSDLRDGLYVAGKIYLLSVGNLYADGGQTNPQGSNSTFFNVYGSDDTLNVYPGDGSLLTSCGDIFQNTSGDNSDALAFVGLSNTPVTCQFMPPDTTPPTVSITSPAAGSTVSGADVALSADASDDTGVAGVQFKVDGVDVGAEDLSSPYSITWSSTSVANGNHVITAVARDAAGNSTTSGPVVVTVNNVVPPTIVTAPTISPNGGSFSSSQTVTLATTTADATIYFTTDGITPTTGSTQYTTPFSVTSTTTVKAIAVRSGMIDSSVSSATFTKSSTSGGGGGSSGGGGTSTPSPTPTPTPSPSPAVILPPNVVAGQVIKFTNLPTIYLVQSTGLHPFDTWASFLAYQAQSGAQIITRDGVASTYTVSPILAKTILGQTSLPTTMPVEGNDFACSGSSTVYYYYKGKKLAYSEAAVFEAWNGKNYAKIKNFGAEVCVAIPDGGLAPLPQGTIVKAVGGSEIYLIQGATARPFTSYSAYLRDSAGKITYTISVSYLHTYSRGENIN